MKKLITILLIIPLICLAQQTSKSKTFYFRGKIYEDVRGNKYVDSVVVPQYSSTVLLYVSSFGVLPISVSSFSASISGNTLTANWTTQSESNNAYFTIEASDDGINWHKLKDIPTKAVNGNSTDKLNYVTQITL